MMTFHTYEVDLKTLAVQQMNKRQYSVQNKFMRFKESSDYELTNSGVLTPDADEFAFQMSEISMQMEIQDFLNLLLKSQQQRKYLQRNDRPNSRANLPPICPGKCAPAQPTCFRTTQFQEHFGALIDLELTKSGFQTPDTQSITTFVETAEHVEIFDFLKF